MKVRKFFIFLLIIVLLFSLTGCYDAKSLETLAYVVALGLDIGENGNLKLSLQIAILSNAGDSGSTSQSSQSTVTSVECSTVEAGINLVNSYISKKVNLSHCKTIVISEELAVTGISNEIFSFVNNLEIRPDCNIIISRCNASDFLDNSTPTLESVAARYYEFILTSSEYTGYSENLNLSDFYNNILNTTGEATAILGGINNKKTHSINDSNNLNGAYKANETPIEYNTSVETMGLAVFKGDKLVGELNNIETMSHLIVTNKLQNATVTIPNPFQDSSSISLNIYLSKSTKNSLKFINGTPYITCKVFVSANSLSIEKGLDLGNNETLEILNQYLSSYLRNNISAYLYKTSKDFNSDIAEFGKYALKNYPTWDDWVTSDWLNNYENAFFNVDVESNVQSGYLFTEL